MESLIVRLARVLYGRRPPVATSWSEADLAANRAGEISPGQRRAIARYAAREIAVTAILGAIAVAVALAPFDPRVVHELAEYTLFLVATTSVFPSGDGARWLVRLARGRVRALRGIHDLTRVSSGSLERTVAGHEVVFPYDFQLSLDVEVIAYVLPRSNVVLAIERTDGKPVTW